AALLAVFLAGTCLRGDFAGAGVRAGVARLAALDVAFLAAFLTTRPPRLDPAAAFLDGAFLAAGRVALGMTGTFPGREGGGMYHSPPRYSSTSDLPKGPLRYCGTRAVRPRGFSGRPRRARTPGARAVARRGPVRARQGPAPGPDAVGLLRGPPHGQRPSRPPPRVAPGLQVPV